MKILSTLLLVVTAGLAVSCREKSAQPASRSATNAVAAVKAFQVKGVIKTVDAPAKTALIQHEAIPDYMPAMTMPFTVREAKELDGLASGDTVTFRFLVTEDDSWIEQIRKTGLTVTNAPASTPPVRLVREVEPLDVGDALPDYRFTNELGRAFNLGDFKGRALAFTFIFTRCPVPNFCPLMSRNFVSAYRQLTALPSAPTNWHLLSLSFDPHFDTPEVLRRYSASYQPDPLRWNFATGALIDIDAITEQFGLVVTRESPAALPGHTLRTVVVDARGKIQKVFIANEWKASELVQEIVKAARVDGAP